MTTINVGKSNAKIAADEQKLREAGVPATVWYDRESMTNAGLGHLRDELPSLLEMDETLIYITGGTEHERTVACAALSKALVLRGASLRFSFLGSAARTLEMYHGGAFMDADGEISRFVRHTQRGYLAIPDLFDPLFGALSRQQAIDMTLFLRRHLYEQGNYIASGAGPLQKIADASEMPSGLVDCLIRKAKIVNLQKKAKA